MPRQLFVEERVVGRQQIEDAAILLQLTLEEQLGFLHERGPQVVVKPREFPVGVRREQPHVANLQPLAEEVPHQRRAARGDRRACAAPAASNTFASRSFPRIAEIEQFVVRNAAPQEERQARRQFDIGKPIRQHPASRWRDLLRSGTENRG